MLQYIFYCSIYVAYINVHGSGWSICIPQQWMPHIYSATVDVAYIFHGNGCSKHIPQQWMQQTYSTAVDAANIFHSSGCCVYTSADF